MDRSRFTIFHKIIFVSLFFSLGLVSATHVLAAEEPNKNCDKLEQEVNSFGGDEKIAGVLNNNCYSAGGLVAKIIQTLSTLAGVGAIIFIILAAHNIITSAGNAEKVAASKRQIIWACMGLIAVIMAYTIILTQTGLVG